MSFPQQLHNHQPHPEHPLSKKFDSAPSKNLHDSLGSSSSGINKLLIPQPTPPSSPTTQVNWISLETPQEIEEALQKHNQTHFGQAHGSFPTIPPFSEWVNWQASTYQGKLSLNGTFHQDELNKLSTSLLHHMIKHTDLDTIWSKITIDEWKN